MLFTITCPFKSWFDEILNGRRELFLLVVSKLIEELIIIFDVVDPEGGQELHAERNKVSSIFRSTFWMFTSSPSLMPLSSKYCSANSRLSLNSVDSSSFLHRFDLGFI